MIGYGYRYSVAVSAMPNEIFMRLSYRTYAAGVYLFHYSFSYTWKIAMAFDGNEKPVLCITSRYVQPFSNVSHICAIHIEMILHSYIHSLFLDGNVIGNSTKKPRPNLQNLKYQKSTKRYYGSREFVSYMRPYL